MKRRDSNARSARRRRCKGVARRHEPEVSRPFAGDAGVREAAPVRHTLAVRVLMVNEFGPLVRGGREQHVDLLAKGLARHGHDVAVAAISGTEQDDQGVESYRVRAWSTLLTHDDRNRPFAMPVGDLRARRSVQAIVRSFRPDVIHAHGWLATAAPRSSAVPTVLTAHDYQLICPRRTLLHNGEVECGGPAGMNCRRCLHQGHGWPRAVGLSAGTTAARRRLGVDLILAVSEFVAGRLRPYVDAPVAVSHNFVADRFFATRPGHAPGVVAFAGDPSAHKGLDLLLDLWRRGTMNPYVLRAALTRSAPAHDTNVAHVEIASVVPAQMPDFWSGAAVAVVPSRWPDPCPTVALEAMASGVPVVGFRVGGLPEVVRDGVDGFLVNPDDTQALAERIQTILAQPDLRARMSTAAIQQARRFGEQRHRQRVVNAYERAISSRGTVR